jgi:sugar-specific transcriptional regulator TrmB
MNVEGRIETLTNLGLTVDQARIYLALLQVGPATARQIANTSKIARPDIYRIIPTIEKHGIIEKLMTRPVSYQAVPAALVLPIMIKHKSTEQQELIKQTEDLLKDLNCNQAKKDQEADTDSVMVYGKDSIIRRSMAALSKAKLSVCVVTSQERFEDAIFELADEWKNASGRGVKIKIATEKPVQKKAALKIENRLSKYPNFEVKYFQSSPSAVVSIIDDEEAFIAMSGVTQFPGAAVLWSKNPSLMALARNYFEDIWSTSSYFEPSIQVIETSIRHKNTETVNTSGSGNRQSRKGTIYPKLC